MRSLAYGLDPADEFGDISSNAYVADALAAVYESPDDVDPWVGALAEDHLPGAGVGPLIATGLFDQFLRLRDGDPLADRHDHRSAGPEAVPGDPVEHEDQ